MTDLLFLEEHKTFADASRRARDLAIQHKQQTGIRRKANGWEVMVPLHFAEKVARSSAIADEDSEPVDSGYDPDDERGGLIEDLESDREDWARSDEEGWYYGDDD